MRNHSSDISNDIGQAGEEYAEKYLQSVGYKILWRHEAMLFEPNHKILRKMKKCPQCNTCWILNRPKCSKCDPCWPYTFGGIWHSIPKKLYKKIMGHLSKKQMRSALTTIIAYGYDEKPIQIKYLVLESLDFICEDKNGNLILIEVKSKLFKDERASHRNRFQINSDAQLKALKFIFKNKLRFELVAIWFSRNKKIYHTKRYIQNAIKISKDKRFLIADDRSTGFIK